MHTDLQDARPFSCHLCPYSCKIRGNLQKHLKGTHKVEMTTRVDLWNKMMAQGQGYQEYLQQERELKSGKSTESESSHLPFSQIH